MPSRLSQITVTEEREERKKRQENFRKRTKSLFNKTRLLAKDTDAWVALIVRDRAGRVQSFRSSGSIYWPPSIQHLITTHPSDTHEFLEKHAISGCWKEVAEDESDMGMVDGDTESVDGGVPATIVKEAAPDSTISVGQCHVGEDVEDGTNAPRDKPNETDAEKLAVDPLGESDTPLLQVKELVDGTLVDAGQLHNAAIDAAGESRNPRVDSLRKDAALNSGMPEDTIFEFESPGNMTVDAINNSNNTTTVMLADSHNPIGYKFGDMDNVLEPLGESMAMPGTTEPDLTAFEYDMIDLDIPGAEDRAQPNIREGDSTEAANILYTSVLLKLDVALFNCPERVFYKECDRLRKNLPKIKSLRDLKNKIDATYKIEQYDSRQIKNFREWWQSEEGSPLKQAAEGFTINEILFAGPFIGQEKFEMIKDMWTPLQKWIKERCNNIDDKWASVESKLVTSGSNKTNFDKWKRWKESSHTTPATSSANALNTEPNDPSRQNSATTLTKAPQPTGSNQRRPEDPTPRKRRLDELDEGQTDSGQQHSRAPTQRLLQIPQLPQGEAGTFRTIVNDLCLALKNLSVSNWKVEALVPQWDESPLGVTRGLDGVS